ncbi:unnamed protein product [Strongylus vulgaris]|uniref:RNA helicase n=1 Tax=Strongylus vulgaris TaxID=40348 RepID=A0A3P7JR04_STRVU|nr:unnamed protein product [Strongylus vulgaris]
MPHVVSLSNQGKWKEGVLTGNFADAEFGFLGSFQELLPEGGGSSKSEKNKKKKSEDHEKSKKNVDVDVQKLDDEKKKKKRKRKKNTEDKVVEDLGDNLKNAQKSEQTVEKEAEQKKETKKKKKKRKQEKEISSTPAKKVKFSAEVTVAEAETSEKENNVTVVAKKDEEAIQRIVIDDEDEENVEDSSKQKSSWEDLYLPGPVMKAIKDLGFQNPTEIQRQVLPLAVRDRCDVLGAAETKKKKKKKKKRKQEKEISSTPAKKVKFSAEVTVAEAETSEKGNNVAVVSKKDEEVIQRIVIDDEDEENVEDSSKQKSSWEDLYLPEPVMKAIKDLGFQNPTEIQRQVLPLAVRDRCDVLGAAETGSGKTLAYAIPMVARLLEMSEQPQLSRTGPKALILAPTRELVVQVMKHVSAMLKYTNFKVFPIVGGLAQVRQARILKERKPEVIVATPGRLWAMMKEEVNLGKLKVVLKALKLYIDLLPS